MNEISFFSLFHLISIGITSIAIIICLVILFKNKKSKISLSRFSFLTLGSTKSSHLLKISIILTILALFFYLLNFGGTDTARAPIYLAMDVSSQVSAEEFDMMKMRAHKFVDDLPTELYVGLIFFADKAIIALPPSLSRDSLKSYITLSFAGLLAGNPNTHNVEKLVPYQAEFVYILPKSLELIAKSFANISVADYTMSKADLVIVGLLFILCLCLFLKGFF